MNIQIELNGNKKVKIMIGEEFRRVWVECRVKSGWTLTQAAMMLKCNKSQLSKFERGRAFPRYKMLSKMQNLMKIYWGVIISIEKRNVTDDSESKSE